MKTIVNDGEYSIVKDDNCYKVYHGEELLMTPGGNIATTTYYPIAKRILQDWKRFGYDSYCWSTTHARVWMCHFSWLGSLRKYLE